MCHFIYDNRYSRKASYKKLLRHLDEVPFTYILEMDGNRAADGEDFRYRFGYENGYDDRLIATYLDDRPCSVLEMMVALAVRCEEHIMEDDDYGDRTGQWFWNMIVSLDLGTMTDRRYDEKYVDYVLERFLRREYKRNGEGGLYTVHNPRVDMRQIEIWYQMHTYLEEMEEAS